MKHFVLLAMFTFSTFGQDTPPTDPVPVPVAPVITWSTPADIRSPAPLGTVQLNATTSVPGVFVYTPAAGTTLAPGDNQTLTVVFTPTDTVNFTTVTTTVAINVLGEWYPYSVPEEVTVCQMDTTKTPLAPAVDSGTGLPRCFLVTQGVSEAMTKFLLTQTNGLDANGKVAYKYASWWDYVVKVKINSMMMPLIDDYPPANVVAAKAAAAAAASAVDAAKAAILQGNQ
jgi:hypothetical protein